MEEKKELTPPTEEKALITTALIPLEEVLSNRLILEIKTQVKRFCVGINIVNKDRLGHEIHLGNISLGNIEISSTKLIVGDKLIFAVIKKIVCDYYKVDFETIIPPTRKREIVIKRQIIQYFTRQYTSFNLAYIGELTGGKGHATILNSCKIINNLIDTNRSVRNEINKIKSLIEESITHE